MNTIAVSYHYDAYYGSRSSKILANFSGVLVANVLLGFMIVSDPDSDPLILSASSTIFTEATTTQKT